MRINEIRKNQVDVTLDSNELVMLGNLMFFYESHYGIDADVSAPGPRFHRLNEQVIIARDLCQYGQLDNFSMDTALRHSVAACPERRLSDVQKALGLMEKEEYAQRRTEQVKKAEDGEEKD